MRISAVFVFIFLLYFENSFATTVIRCNNPAYAGKKLTFLTPADPITGETQKAFELVFSADGEASTTFTPPATTFVYADFGVYRGLLFVVPNQNIQLLLPPFRAKNFAEEKNPYFQPINFWFRTKSGNQLSDHIGKFEAFFNRQIDQHFKELYLKQLRVLFEHIKDTIESEFRAINNPVFTQHKTLSLKLIEADIFRLKPQEYAGLFNQIPQTCWLHPKFMEAFNNTFDSQLSFLAAAVNGRKITEAVEKHDLNLLQQEVQNQFHVQGAVAQLALLKMLHDANYSNEFRKEDIKVLVQNTRFIQNKNTIIRTTAQNMLQKFDFLAVGSTAPVICLKTLDGTPVCTNRDRSKFKYIVFADTETPVCREHLKYLSRLRELFGKQLEIFVVLRDTDPGGIRQFLTENDLVGTILLDKDNTTASTYKIRSYPTCFCLDEQHRIVFPFTKPPLDGFEQQFGPYLRHELFMRQRNQGR